MMASKKDIYTDKIIARLKGLDRKIKMITENQSTIVDGE